MWDSDDNKPQTVGLGATKMCKTPTGHFGINFQPSNDFEKGMGVAVIVDGVICQTKVAAKQLVDKRIDELYAQWVAQVEKM